jgi:hypothetical protein
MNSALGWMCMASTTQYLSLVFLRKNLSQLIFFIKKLCTAPPWGNIAMIAFPVCKKTSISRKRCVIEVTSLQCTMDKIIGIIRQTLVRSCYRSFRIWMHTSRGPQWRISYVFLPGVHKSLIIPQRHMINGKLLHNTTRKIIRARTLGLTPHSLLKDSP